MSIDNQKIYPNCPIISRTVEVGGLTKSQLMMKLQENSIMLNEYGERLFADEKFTISDTKYRIETVEVTVSDLGFLEGATTPEIFNRASELGLELCPIELGPYLRLEYHDQPEGNLRNSDLQHQAPSGSITIASEALTEDDDFPKGFYLRQINGELWLRGYRADDLHVWNPGDHFIFVKQT